jgi:lipoate-protein ligase A
MERDQALLVRAVSAQQVLARLYQWDGLWVSLGRHQTPHIVLRHPNQTPWVKRPTGGGGVLHGHDLTVSLSAPLALLKVPRTQIRRVHSVLLSPLIEALNSLGIPAKFGQASSPTGKGIIEGDCFLTASQNDIIDPTTGRKLIGCALRITGHAVLAQCSIPVEEPLAPPEEIFYQAHSPAPLGVPMALLREAMSEALRKWGIGEASPMPTGGTSL